MTEPKVLEITLDPNGVIERAQRVIIIASQVVATTLRALSKDDLSPPEMLGQEWGYQFVGAQMEDAERRETFQNWLLSKGFQDLARGIREMLEEAALYLSLITQGTVITTLAEANAYVEKRRDSIAQFNFPKLLGEVNKGLTEPTAFEAEFLSLQKVRNCLEHRGGRVGARDVDETGTMTLSFPRLRAFYRDGDAEVELVPGKAIDTHDPANPFGRGENVEIYMNRATRTRTYALNEPVVITPSEFFEIAMACHLFASDVASKMPAEPATTP